jgi:hypothetical protein
MRNLVVAAISLGLMAQAAAAQTTQAPLSVDCSPRGTRSQPIWEETEAHCLGLLGGIAERTRGVLRLKMENGEPKSFEDVREGCESEPFVFEKCFVFRLLAYSQEGGSFLVNHAYSECGAIVMISRRTGEELRLPVMPTYSPNTKRLVAVDPDELCGRQYDIAIWSTVTALPTLEWQYNHSQDGPYEVWDFVRWDGDDRIELRAQMFDGKGGAVTYDTEAIRTAQGWQLTRPWVKP